MPVSCPFCFQNLPSNLLAFSCSECEQVVDESATAIAGWEINRPPITEIRYENGEGLAPPQCQKCQNPCQQEACPTCHRDLPEGWRHRYNTFTVAFAGSVSAGKSIFIGSLITSLRKYITDNRGTFLGVMNSDNTYRRYYYDPLFKENERLPGTPRVEHGESAYQRDPLIWDIELPQVSFTLVMRDIAGEDIQAATQPRQPEFSFLTYADLVVFLFDPMILDTVQRRLRNVVQFDNNDADVPAHEAYLVFQNLRNQIQGTGNALAITVSKFDVLQEMAQLPEIGGAIMANIGAFFNRESYLEKSREVSWQQHFVPLQQEIYSLLDSELEGIELNNHVRLAVNRRDGADPAFQYHGYFACSSLGESPGIHLTRRGISPFRVLDPILWGLSVKGIELPFGALPLQQPPNDQPPATTNSNTNRDQKPKRRSRLRSLFS